MKPVDPRLLRYARTARLFFGFGAVLGLAQTACIVAFAWLVSHIVVAALGGAALSSLALPIAALVGVVAVRSVVVWLMELNAARGAVRVKSELRRQVLAALPRLGPAWMSERSSAAVTTTITSGLDALDTYFSKYLPQLILTALATPVLLAVLFWFDWQSGLTVLLTLPLIPVFMILIGWATQAAQQAQWQQLSRLSTSFLDVVEGLSTLKVFGRASRQVSRIRTVTEEYRASTMKVLRLSFLSGFVLELAASLAVALVAVSIGLRLISGDLGLGVGLFVLLLTPEAFLPLRQVGAQFHAAAEGVAATDDVFALLDAAPAAATADAAAAAATADACTASRAAAVTPAAPAAAATPAATIGATTATLPATGTTAAAAAAVRVDGLTLRYGTGSDETVAVADFRAEFAAGSLSVIAGPSGAGKSSILAAMLGFASHTGRISMHTAATSRPLTRDDIAWAGQRPGLFEGTIAENVALGSLHPSVDLVSRSLALAAALELAPDTLLGVDGAGLSGGQAQRVAVARAIYRHLDRACPVLLLDEPSSALDPATESRLLSGLRLLANRGAIVVVVSHRDQVRRAADLLVELEPRHPEPTAPPVEPRARLTPAAPSRHTAAISHAEPAGPAPAAPSRHTAAISHAEPAAEREVVR